MKEGTKKTSSKFAPARTPEEREMQMISMAVDQAEEQLRNHTASNQVLVHFLKLGTSRAQAEKERLELENKLLEAKTEAIQATRHTEELYQEAIAAFRSYNGTNVEEE